MKHSPTQSDKDLKVANNALNNAPVPADGRYVFGNDGKIYGPTSNDTDLRSEVNTIFNNYWDLNAMAKELQEDLIAALTAREERLIETVLDAANKMVNNSLYVGLGREKTIAQLTSHGKDVKTDE